MKTEKTTRRKAVIALVAFAFAVLAAFAGGAVRAQEEDWDEESKAIVKPIKTLVQAIRYKKDEVASRSLAHDRMSETVCGAAWSKLTDAEKKEFVEGLAYLMEKMSFPRAREDYFDYIDTILYEKPRIDAKKARLKQTIVIHKKAVKEEVVLEYELEKIEDRWLIFDVFLEEESTLAGIKEDTVEPILEDGGTPLLMKKLREKVAEVKKKEAEKPAGSGEKKS